MKKKKFKKSYRTLMAEIELLENKLDSGIQEPAARIQALSELATKRREQFAQLPAEDPLHTEVSVYALLKSAEADLAYEQYQLKKEEATAAWKAHRKSLPTTKIEE